MSFVDVPVPNEFSSAIGKKKKDGKKRGEKAANILAGIGIGLGGLGGIVNPKSDAAPAAETPSGDEGKTPPAEQGLSMGAKIGIGVGIAALLGTIGYFVFRK